MSKRKTVIIGAGHVGAHVASALMMQDICEEIILLDTDAQKAWSMPWIFRIRHAMQERIPRSAAADMRSFGMRISV